MTQLAMGLARKQRGQNRMEVLDRDWLLHARAYAQRISEAMGSVTSDAIHSAVNAGDMPKPHRAQSYGCLFRGKHWLYVGMAASTIATNHGRMISVWRWRP